MSIDMSRLISERPIAVRFTSKEDAVLFLEAMQAQYPSHVRGWPRATYPGRYERDGGVCYCPYLNYDGGSMTHASKRYFEEECGYEVIEFVDLLCSDSDIDEAELPIAFLLS